MKTSNFIQKMVVFYWTIIEKHEKKIVFYGKTLKIHEKVVEKNKNWSKIEKNELLFGENIKFHSKNGHFLLKRYRKTRKKGCFYENTVKIHEKGVEINKKLV